MHGNLKNDKLLMKKFKAFDKWYLHHACTASRAKVVFEDKVENSFS